MQGQRATSLDSRCVERRPSSRKDAPPAGSARLFAAEIERARAAERERLAREIHDGLGSALMSSLVLVEQGRMDIQAVSKVLRECVDDLKLTIDSMEPIGGDLATLLAMLRFRFGRRIEAAGIAIHWEVGSLPALAWLDPPAALNVLRILQEALTNVLKHAQAAAITVRTERRGASLHVSVLDDGRGLDRTGGGIGRGLANMRRRADELGARLQVETLERGTRVCLQLPIDRTTAGESSRPALEMRPRPETFMPAHVIGEGSAAEFAEWRLRLTDAVQRLVP